MKYSHVITFLLLTTNLMAQSPVKETFAYSRKTIPGPRGNDAGPMSTQSPFPTAYFIYVVAERGSVISVAGVFVQGKLYDASLKKVESPVVIDQDVSVPTGKKDTLVKKTPDDVYRIELEGPKVTSDKDLAVDNLAQQNQVVVCVKSGKANWYGVVKRIVPLHPAAAM
jgi:hypothetical protein